MFIGRERELASLALLLEKSTSSIVACRGRRRIGKSTLIYKKGRKSARTCHSDYPRLELSVFGYFGAVANSSHCNVCKGVNESCQHHGKTNDKS